MVFICFLDQHGSTWINLLNSHSSCSPLRLPWKSPTKRTPSACRWEPWPSRCFLVFLPGIWEEKTANLPAPEKKKFHFNWCQWDMGRALLGVNVDCAIDAAVVMVVSRSWSCLNSFSISFKAQSIRINSLSRLAQTYRHCHVVWLSLPFLLTPGFCGSGGLVSHLQAVGRFNMLSWICEAWTNCSPGIDPKTSWSISI